MTIISPEANIDRNAKKNDSLVGSQPRRKIDDDNNNNNKPVFDPWKQLVEGNGERIAASHDVSRIPAIVYVSRNCVRYRTKAANLLAREFQDLATSGMETKFLKINNTTTNFQALHKRAAEFNKARKSNAIHWNNEPQDNHRDHQKNLPTAAIAADRYFSNKIKDDNGNWESSFVHYGGQCRVQGGIPVPPLEGWKNNDRNTFPSNYETIYTRYKYCLVMENTKMDGYVTEKLLHGLLGGCMPIYYGSKDVYQIFRNNSFVFMDIDNPQPALDELRRLENDPAEYYRRTDRRLPLLKSSSQEDPYDTAATIDSYFSIFPTIGTGKLSKKLHEMMGLEIPKSLVSEV